MKTCCRCHAEKPLTEFYVSKTRGRPLSTCKPCGAEKSKAYRHQNPDFEKRRYAREKLETRERHLVRKYGVTLADYDSMFEAQGGACAVCSKTQARAFDVDHCHTTGRVRGLLCTNCNRMVGHAHDNSARLRAAAEYLERSIVPQVAAAFVRAAA